MARRTHPFEQSLPRHPSIGGEATALTIDELEAGLRTLGRVDVDSAVFWEDNEQAFRETVRLAIRETSAALLLPGMSTALRAELEVQLEWLKAYLDGSRTLN